ncbi:MAG: type II toxin-antitoxin system PemK/MazF family toxin [Bryobacteraceae bacterium]|jgi:mRNA interferase MazF
MAETRRTRTASHGWPKRGEIYLTALDPAVGHEIKKTRPALVIQNDTSNRYSAVTMVAPITSTVRLPLSPLHVLLPAGSATGLAVASVGVFNQIRAVDRKRLIKKLGAVDALVLAQVDGAIEAAFGLTLSPFDRESPPTITEAISASTEDFQTGRYER